jgi:hypothetical protein
MLKKFFIKRAIKNSLSDAGKAIKREIHLVKRATHNLGKSLSDTRIPIKIKGR